MTRLRLVWKFSYVRMPKTVQQKNRDSYGLEDIIETGFVWSRGYHRDWLCMVSRISSRLVCVVSRISSRLVCVVSRISSRLVLCGLEDIIETGFVWSRGYHRDWLCMVSRISSRLLSTGVILLLSAPHKWIIITHLSPVCLRIFETGV